MTDYANSNAPGTDWVGPPFGRESPRPRAYWCAAGPSVVPKGGAMGCAASAGNLDDGQRLFERDGQHLVHGVDEMQLHGVAQVFGDLGHVLFVFLGQDDFEESGAMRGQKLFLQSRRWAGLCRGT